MQTQHITSDQTVFRVGDIIQMKRCYPETTEYSFLVVTSRTAKTITLNFIEQHDFQEAYEGYSSPTCYQGLTAPDLSKKFSTVYLEPIRKRLQIIDGCEFIINPNKERQHIFSRWIGKPLEVSRID